MSKLLEGLNPSQQKAVQTINGTIQINAVAGSGKTRVLTHRVAYMLEQKIKPNNILLTTFTKKATEEMTTRLGALIPKMAIETMTIGTSHSIGFRILKKEYDNMGHPLASAFKSRDGVLMNGSLKIFAENIKKEIMMDRTVEFTVKQELTDIAIPQLMKAIGLSKNEGIDDIAYQAMHTGKGARMEAYIEFFSRYERKKKSEKKIDADDMLYLLWKLLKEYPDILAKYQRIYKYILVDESQDNNQIQYDIFRMLAAPEYNLFIVGDDDQAMYGFRGAKPQEFIHFKENYRNVTQIALEDNYRSNPGILNVANQLIRNNTERIDKTLKAHKTDNAECVAYSVYKDEDAEAEDTVKEIQMLVSQEGYSYKQMAILYRVNAQSRAFEDRLIMNGIPYVIHGGITFYERKEVKDLVAYLQLVIDPSDDKSFKRVINVPSRFLGKAFMEKVNACKGSNWEAINGGMKFTKDYEKRGAGQFIDLIDTLRSMLDREATPTELVDYLLIEGGYKDYILGEDEEEESSRMENIETLKFVLGRYKNLQEFLDYITLMTSTAKHSIDGVQLMSIHKSKGLEFPVAFLSGASEGLLPHFKSIEESESGDKPLAVEEERRLAYVAVTRAESLAYVSSPRSFNGKPCNPSRFANEMGLSCKEDRKVEIDIESTRKKEPVRTPIRMTKEQAKASLGGFLEDSRNDYAPISVLYLNH